MSRKISSRDNPAFKQLLRITASARERRQLGVSFIEGIHLCESYLGRFGVPRQVVHTDAALADPQVRALVEAARDAGPAELLGGRCAAWRPTGARCLRWTTRRPTRLTSGR